MPLLSRSTSTGHRAPLPRCSPHHRPHASSLPLRLARRRVQLQLSRRLSASAVLCRLSLDSSPAFLPSSAPSRPPHSRLHATCSVVLHAHVHAHLCYQAHTPRTERSASIAVPITARFPQCTGAGNQQLEQAHTHTHTQERREGEQRQTRTHSVTL